MEISSKENLEKYRIMIVEDEPDIAEGLKYLIERMGYSYFVTGIHISTSIPFSLALLILK